MTDFTATIETTAESIEDLQKGLEEMLEDMLGIGVTVEQPEVRIDEYGSHLRVDVEIDSLERELERRLDVDEVWTNGLSAEITPMIPEESQENEIEAGIRDMVREEAEDVVDEEMDGDLE